MALKSILKRVYNTVYKEPVFPGNKEIVGSYSQNGEDLIVDAILGSKKNGTYIDIGANDPVALNNTYRFYRRGWKGICVEPIMGRCATLREKRPNDIIINAGVSEEEGVRPLYLLNPDTLSTFGITAANAMVLERGAVIMGTFNTPVYRLERIFEENVYSTELDVMSVDVEGAELDVLKSNNWFAYRPSVLVIEMGSESQRITEFLETENYVPVLRNAENGIFVDVGL